MAEDRARERNVRLRVSACLSTPLCIYILVHGPMCATWGWMQWQCGPPLQQEISWRKHVYP